MGSISLSASEQATMYALYRSCATLYLVMRDVHSRILAGLPDFGLEGHCSVLDSVNEILSEGYR